MGHSLNDYAKLQLFRGLLDTSSRREIEERVERNPATIYAQCFQMMRRNMVGNVDQQMRQAWFKVELRQRGPTLTLRDWMDFMREFKLNMSRVDDRTPEEAHRLLMKNLPVYWRKRVLREEARNSALKPWAKITKCRLISDAHVRKLLKEKGIRVHQVVQCQNGKFEVECKTVKDRQKLLDLDHTNVAGGLISVCTHKKPMNPEELISLMTEWLKIEEEERAYSLQSHSRESSLDRGIHQVTPEMKKIPKGEESAKKSDAPVVVQSSPLAVPTL